MNRWPAIEEARLALAGKLCPSCGRAGSLTIDEQWLPLGPAHVAGVQMKMSAQRQWLLVCSHCGTLGTLQPDDEEVDEQEPPAPD